MLWRNQMTGLSGKLDSFISLLMAFANRKDPLIQKMRGADFGDARHFKVIAGGFAERAFSRLEHLPVTQRTK
jgi:hypothetical protein